MRHTPEWWKGFFSGLALDLWRQAIPEEHTRAEARFIEKALHLKPRSRVLDVPCGNGRLALKLAQRGSQVTGVDICAEFVTEARARAAKLGLRADFEKREMRDLPWIGKFDGAFCFGNSFGYLDDEGNSTFLRAMAQTLKPGGRFVLDASSCAELIFPRFKDHEETQFGDITFREENHYDPLMGRMITDYTFTRGNTIERKTGSHRIYTYQQLHEMLEAAGFEVSQSCGSPQEERFRLGSPNLLLVTKKREN